ncbi:MAG: rhomboid family intramembrane serine protease, partial [Bacteroidota bacterium]
LLFYITAIIFSCYFQHQYHIRQGTLIQAIGASGGVFAVKFASLCLGFSRRNIENIRILNLFLFLYYFFKIYSQLATSHLDNIAHEAHFGGAIYGIAFAFFYYPKLLFSANPHKDSFAENEEELDFISYDDLE